MCVLLCIYGWPEEVELKLRFLLVLDGLGRLLNPAGFLGVSASGGIFVALRQTETEEEMGEGGGWRGMWQEKARMCGLFAVLVLCRAPFIQCSNYMLASGICVCVDVCCCCFYRMY